MGVSVSGGKNDKTFVSVLEYYPSHGKLFLSHIYDKIRTEGEVSGDAALFQIVQHGHKNVQSVAMDVPLSLPLCMTCKLKCPGFENCKESHIQWLWKHYRNTKQKKKTHRLFTPYTQRSVEIYVSEDLPDRLHMQNALGANLAPLACRSLFLKRRTRKVKFVEVFTPLSVIRIGRSLSISEKDLQGYRHSMTGFDSRHRILKELTEKDIVFVYQQDIQKMLEWPNAFESFVSALTGFLEYQGDCEPRPVGFPKKEQWIGFPKKELRWKR